jgi:hypothetical protein
MDENKNHRRLHALFNKKQTEKSGKWCPCGTNRRGAFYFFVVCLYVPLIPAKNKCTKHELKTTGNPFSKTTYQEEMR